MAASLEVIDGIADSVHHRVVAKQIVISTISDRTCTKITFASEIGLKTFKWAGSGINNANNCAELCSSGTYLNVADGAAGCARETAVLTSSVGVDCRQQQC